MKDFLFASRSVKRKIAQSMSTSKESIGARSVWISYSETFPDLQSTMWLGTNSS